VQRYGSRAPISFDPAGTFRWHLNRAVALRDSEGNILLRFVGTSTDVHDSRLAPARSGSVFRGSSSWAM
jgi:hypothetical protein